MSGHRKWAEIRAESDNPERQARVSEEKRLMGVVMTLQEMREQLGVSQEDLARAWETSQPNVSKIEHKDDLLFSTVRRYVEALGGRLDVQAVFADRLINLQFGEDAHTTESSPRDVRNTPTPSLSTAAAAPERHSENDPGR
jgi:DNA-binding transcriptional regulator YiaG